MKIFTIQNLAAILLSSISSKAIGLVRSALLASAFTCFTALAQPVITYFHNNISGSPMVATDAAGNVVWKESYRPYGDKLRNEPASRNGTNKIGYAGSPFDANTGLSYMGARYYDPVIGRFMGIDPVGFQEDNIHSFNRYAYANNNPYKYIDKNGKYAELVFEAMSLTAGFNSLINNMRSGNYGAAAVDGGGIVADVIGAIIPGAPGVAGLGIKASREAAGEVGQMAVINAQKQAGHVSGTPQNINRIKQEKATSTFHGEQSGEMATQIANQKGVPVPGRPNVKEHDFGVGIGTGPNGGTQTRVRVHTSPKNGEIHGHPSGPERF